ncbi:MAG: B12-binding domain-containing protein [Ectobacillus sp.]
MSLGHSEKLAHLFLHGNFHSSLSFLQQEISSGATQQSIYELVTNSMYIIGDLWKKNKISVAQEHIASAICKQTLSILNYMFWSRPVQQQRPKVILFYPEHESHDIGLQIIHSTFITHGFESRLLGANLPLSDALHYIYAWKPEIVGISISANSYTNMLSEYISAIRTFPFIKDILIGGCCITQQTPVFSDNVSLIKHINDLYHWIEKQVQAYA